MQKQFSALLRHVRKLHVSGSAKLRRHTDIPSAHAHYQTRDSLMCARLKAPIGSTLLSNYRFIEHYRKKWFRTFRLSFRWGV